MRTAFILASILLLVATPAVAADPKNETIPLSKYSKHQELLSKASSEASLINIDVKASTKHYEHDVWAGVGPAKARVSCVRFHSSSGFRLHVDAPKFSVAGDTLTIDQRIAKIAADGLHAQFQLGPCVESSVKFGIVASDVHFIYKAKPVLAFDGKGLCKMRFGGETDKIDVKIGGFNAHGVQNDLDKLVKKWAEHSLETSLNAMYPMSMGNMMAKVSLDFCGKG
jgi:hypothetical protein